MLPIGAMLRPRPTITTRRPGNDRDEPRDPQQPNHPEQRHALANPGQIGQTDDQEVEEVPAAAEELLRAPAVRRDAHRDLEREQTEEDVVQNREQVAVLFVDRVIGFEPDDDGVRQNREHDRQLKGA